MPTPYNSIDLYNYPLFSQIWASDTDFINDYNACSIPTTITEQSAKLLYGLLIGRYYNSPINFDSIGQWKQQFMSVIYCYGPSWEKKLELQKKLRTLTDDEIFKGSRQMYNNAANPSTPVMQADNTEKGTLSDKELNFIKEQNVTLNERGKLEGYGYLYDLIVSDVTTDFLRRFDNLFLNCVSPQRVPFFIYQKEN